MARCSYASKHRERAAEVAQEFGIETVAADWREVVARPDVDLVSVVTPPATHMEMTLAALSSRQCSVRTDGDERRGSEQMVERAREAKVLAVIDHELRFLKSRRTMRMMWVIGAIGSVRHCNYVFSFDYRGVLDRPWAWWSDETMGGGTLGATARMPSIRFVSCWEPKSRKSRACSIPISRNARTKAVGQHVA